MARTKPGKRPGRTKTISISVDSATERILRDEADARYGGNVSRLVAAIAVEARRRAAFERIMRGYSRMMEQEAFDFWERLESDAKKKRRQQVA